MAELDERTLSRQQLHNATCKCILNAAFGHDWKTKHESRCVCAYRMDYGWDSSNGIVTRQLHNKRAQRSDALVLRSKWWYTVPAAHSSSSSWWCRDEMQNLFICDGDVLQRPSGKHCMFCLVLRFAIVTAQDRRFFIYIHCVIWLTFYAVLLYYTYTYIYTYIYIKIYRAL